MDERADAANANMVTHVSWTQRLTPGMRVIADAGLTIVDSGLACDTFNIVCRARLSPAEAAGRVRAAIGYFAAVGRPFAWWVEPADRPRELGQILVDGGLVAAESDLAMVIDCPVQAVGIEVPPALRIERVQTASQLAAFGAIVAANWTPPDPAVTAFYRLGAAALLAADAPVRLYVGVADGRPVAAGELVIADGVGGLYNICTLAAVRRRGYASALTSHALREAWAAGCRMTVLQAAPAGIGLYARLGFRPFGTITEYRPRERP